MPWSNLKQVQEKALSVASSMPDIFYEWLNKMTDALIADPSATAAEFNGKVVFDAFVKEYPLTDDDWFVLALFAGDIISRRPALILPEHVQAPLPHATESNPVRA